MSTDDKPIKDDRGKEMKEIVIDPNKPIELKIINPTKESEPDHEKNENTN